MVHNMVISELAKKDVKPNLYSYAELRVATDNFNPSNKLGQGGFGVVYKVCIPINFLSHLLCFCARK